MEGASIANADEFAYSDSWSFAALMMQVSRNLIVMDTPDLLLWAHISYNY